MMKAAYIFVSGTKRQRAKLGVSMKMSNGKIKLYKASRILSIPALVVNGCPGSTPQKEEHMDLSVYSEVRGIVFGGLLCEVNTE